METKRMKRNSNNDAKASERAPCSGHTIVTGECPGSGGVPNTDAGKVASALLAKHVRTLEVLHSLQVDNAKLRRENQLKLNEDDVKRRIDEAVAEAIKGPNDISEELQSLIEGMRTRNSELEGELAEAKAASTKILDHAASQMESLRAEIQKLKTKCADLQFEMSRSARQASRQEELESRLQDLAGNLAASESRTKDLARRLTEKDAKSRNLELRVEERNQTILAMKTAEATLKSSLDENKARATALERESQELQRGLKTKEHEGDKLGSRLKEAVENIASLKKEAADMTAKEETLRAELEEERARANTAEMKATEERKRCHKLQGEGKQRLEEEDRKYKEMSMRYSVERQELLARIDALSRELFSLRAHLNSNRSQFSKYVEAKTENNQLKQEIDGLKEMIVAPRPPRRRHSHGSNATSIIGGLCSSKRHASVERLRHSISVARDHGSSSNNSRSNIVVQRHHQEGTCNGNTSVVF